LEKSKWVVVAGRGVNQIFFFFFFFFFFIFSGSFPT
jgi:hypothetical protein